MKNLIYPAIFEKENDGYIVSFPDFEGCVTEGDTIEDAYKYAKEVLALRLDGIKAATAPSAIESVQLAPNQRVMLVEADKRDDIVYFKKSEIPQFIDTALENKGFTKCQLAKILGVDRSYVTRIANGDRLPSPEMAQRIATLLEFDWRVFFTYAQQR